MAGIKDVAEKSGVSISTVSYVMSGKRSVRDDTKRKVIEAARSLGYRPKHVEHMDQSIAALLGKELITSFNGVLEKNALGFYPDWPTSTFYDELNSSLQELVNGTTDVKGVLNQMKDNYDKGVEAAGVKS